MAQQPRYQVIERIDAGGMAEVFKASSTSLHGFSKLVAIKRVLPSLTKNERFVRMFLDEAKVSLILNHANCVQVFDLGIADGTYFIVMEFIDGTNLKNFIEQYRKRGGHIPVEQAVWVAMEICRGLAHAHQKIDIQGHRLEIVHRDISPPNVLISREGEVKITDFGLAKAKSQVEHTDPGVVKGKFGYLSPEAAYGNEVDARTDIFATGIVLWEMLAGERLFQGKSDYETLQLVRQSKVPPLKGYRSDVPQALEIIVQKSLARDPQERYQDSTQLGRDLATFLFGWGRAVSSFDIGLAVVDIMKAAPSKPKAPVDSAIQEAVQRQVNQIMSLEEIEDLDRYLLEEYGAISEAVYDPDAADGNFEDPRGWADLGFGEEGVDAEVPALTTAENRVHQASDAPTWQEGSLDEVRKATRAMRAVRKKEPPKPVDDMTAELSTESLSDIRMDRLKGSPDDGPVLRQHDPLAPASPSSGPPPLVPGGGSQSGDSAMSGGMGPGPMSSGPPAMMDPGSSSATTNQDDGSNLVMIYALLAVLLLVLVLVVLAVMTWN